jgi:hypothetical protein
MLTTYAAMFSAGKEKSTEIISRTNKKPLLIEIRVGFYSTDDDHGGFHLSFQGLHEPKRRLQTVQQALVTVACDEAKTFR